MAWRQARLIAQSFAQFQFQFQSQSLFLRRSLFIIYDYDFIVSINKPFLFISPRRIALLAANTFQRGCIALASTLDLAGKRSQIRFNF